MNIKLKNLYEYERINDFIKNDIKESFGSFNDKRNGKIMPLNKNEICNEINKEIAPILFSFNNNIKYSTLENYNAFNYFILKEKVTEEIQNKISNLNNKIDEINNKLNILKEKNTYDKISIDNSKIDHKQKIFNITSKENVLEKYYKRIKKNIIKLGQKQEELLINMKKINKLNNELNSLNDIRQNIKVHIESAENDIDKKLNLFKLMRRYLFFIKI